VAVTNVTDVTTLTAYDKVIIVTNNVGYYGCDGCKESYCYDNCEDCVTVTTVKTVTNVMTVVTVTTV
jgi:hypothetical protein